MRRVVIRAWLRVNPMLRLCSNILQLHMSEHINVRLAHFTRPPCRLLHFPWPAPSSIRSCSATPSARRRCAQIFSDRALIQRYIEVEVALARAEARCGVIPRGGGRSRSRANPRIERIDFDHMRHETDIVGYPILPLVHQLVGDVRRGRPLRALGRDHAGHHGHRRRAAGARCARQRRRRHPRAARHPGRRSRRSIATRRWPAAPICSRRCR